MNLTKALSAVVLASAAGLAHSADIVVFSDNFEASAVGSNITPTGWIALAGAVDTLGTSYYGNLCTAAGLVGNCVDLDGTLQNPGILLQVNIPVVAGNVYTASFQLAGNQRAGTDNIEVSFGQGTPNEAVANYSLGVLAPAATYTLTFTAISTGSATLSFENAIAVPPDNIGALLDNVVITTPVPEPETMAMMLAGLGLIGFLQRRRRS